MTLSTKYDPSQVEDKWYQIWLEKGFFRSTPDDREPYTIVIPPPNVTGVLHMGHMLNNTIQDVLIRRARMMGKNALWVPGTDHASIATEAKVVAMLKEQGISKNDISREEFLGHAWQWREKYGGIILEQLKKLGASCDWDRTKFTMDKELSDSVIHVFADLYNKGHLYRGYRMVNWDPMGRTALADDEVIHQEVQSKLYYVKYSIEGADDSLTVATTRPETILADTAICFNPGDRRFEHLKGKRAVVPLVNRSVPIIQDDYVDMEFGTGCLKVTPAHDPNDYEIAQRHNLEVIGIFNEDGTLNERAQLYVGEDRLEIREAIVKDLEQAGHLEKTEPYVNKVGYSERTHVPIEPRLSLQWYVRMDDWTSRALTNVMNDTIQLVPPKFKNTYKHWMENVRDWCISRQLWWGQRIPAYYLSHDGQYDPEAKVFVAVTAEEALTQAQEETGNMDLSIEDLHQDEDVLDTWFSSGLWPITVFNGILAPDNREINYYYPTNDLVTAPEILFFWIARMIIYGYEYRNEKPFSNVYLTGIVRDKQRRKMSKSLGNSPDPLELIKNYGADGVRTGMLFSSPAGNDLLFEEKLCEQGRNFSNKIWNAFRLIQGWEIEDTLDSPAGNETATNWFENRFNDALGAINAKFEKFRISDALMTTYSLVWDDFCSWYLEMVKPKYGHPIDRHTYDRTIHYFELVIRLLHPFMPFISEELWHQIKKREENDCLIVANWPEGGTVNTDLLRRTSEAFELISAIRNIRSEKNIGPGQELDLIGTDPSDELDELKPLVIKMAGLSSFVTGGKKEEGSVNFVLGQKEYFIPLSGGINKEEEAENLRKELAYTKGFLVAVVKKLSNRKFVTNAPEKVVETERKKQSDAEAKIRALEKALAELPG